MHARTLTRIALTMFVAVLTIAVQPSAQSQAYKLKGIVQQPAWPANGQVTLQQLSISNNGPVGISAGLGSQVTLYDNAQITGHTGPGVELYGNSQLRTFSANLISSNGSAGGPRSAGIVVDGNSEAYLRGGTITTNHGPGILVLVNSSVDSEGATFSGNTGGNFSCDSSSYGVSDLIPPNGASAGCRSPHNLGNRRGLTAAPAAHDLNAGKNQAALYKKFASHK